VKRVLACACIISLLAVSVLPQPEVKQSPTVQDSVTAKAQADSALAASQYRVIKKDLVVSDQVKLGTAVMVFIIVVMSLSKNFNPS